LFFLLSSLVDPVPHVISNTTNNQAKLVKGTDDQPLPGGFKHGVAFESYILHAPNYLAHLAAGLRARGVPFFRRRLAAIDEAFDLPETGRVDLVVNALALGNKTLIGVMDDNMYPAQGQTVLVKAPLVNTCTMATGDTVKTTPKGGAGALKVDDDDEVESVSTQCSPARAADNVRALCNAIAPDDGAQDAKASSQWPSPHFKPSSSPQAQASTPRTELTEPGNPDAIAYIIPRPGPDGHVVCGGTYNRDNWMTQPSMAEAERILRACYALDPRLAGPGGKSWEDIEIVSHNVGLRPSRDGGVRLQVEKRPLGPATLAPRFVGRKRDVTVVHAYGPGGTGYQSSIGLAQKCGDLVMGEINAGAAASKL
jgi:hypothetical protein